MKEKYEQLLLPQRAISRYASYCVTGDEYDELLFTTAVCISLQLHFCRVKGHLLSTDALSYWGHILIDSEHFSATNESISLSPLVRVELLSSVPTPLPMAPTRGYRISLKQIVATLRVARRTTAWVIER